MNPQLIVYVEQISPRIDYILDFIWSECAGFDLVYVFDYEEFKSLYGPKLNFSNFSDANFFSLKVDDFLLHTNIDKKLNYKDLHPIGRCFYWLSRYEEYIGDENYFDQHNRFLGSDFDYSIPIVDEIVYDLHRQFLQFYPDIQIKNKTFRQINTHDVDFSWKYLNHGFQKNFLTFAKNLLQGNFAEIKEQIQILIGQKSDPYDQFEYLKNHSQKYQTETIFFWLLGDRNPFDKNVKWFNKKHQKLIQETKNWAEIGIHPSYFSNQESKKLKEEIQRLQTILNQKIEKSRQHFITLKYPKTYQNLLSNGIVEDYTMGFPHKIGFRAGTSHDFFWFDLSQNQKTKLRVFPFVAMDVTLRNYLKYSPDEAIVELKKLKNLVREYNGNFITIFHQSNFSDEWAVWRKVYESIFDEN